jgi:integrase
MRSGEILSLTWGQVYFVRKTVTVGKATTAAGTGSVIPMNQSLVTVLASHADWFTSRFGTALPDHYLFPFGPHSPSDPNRPMTTIKHAWETARGAAGLRCRLHDLRHTAITRLAEAGASEATMLALAGHMSPAMLERYSHVCLNAKRDAVEAPNLASIFEPVPAEGETLSIQ